MTGAPFGGSRAHAAASLLWDHWRSSARLDELPAHVRPHERSEGYAIQPEVARLSGQATVGWKIAATSAAGIIEITNGRSPRVGRMTSRALTQFLQHALSTRQASAEQIFQLRQPIEERAAELAALNRTDDDVEALRRAVAAMRRAGLRRETYVKADLRFHEALGVATGNPLFAVIGAALRTAMTLSIRESLRGRRSQDELDQVVLTHERIVDAIEAGQSTDARRLMTQHFDEAAAPIRRQALASGSLSAHVAAR